VPAKPYKPTRNPTKIGFLLEAPGTEDLNKGRPLSGNLGKLFGSMLRTAGIDFDEVWIGYVFNDKMPDEAFAKLKEARDAGFDDWPECERGFLRPDHYHHLDRLRADLDSAGVNVLVPLGNIPLWALTGSKTMDKVRGATQAASRVKPGLKIVPTFHPGFVRLQWKYFTIVVGDIQKAVREAAKGPELCPPRVELTVIPTEQEVMDWFDKYLPGCDLLSVDIETGWGQITSMNFAVDDVYGICIPIIDLSKPDRSYYSEAEEIRIWQRMKDVLQSPVPKLGQNFAQYDLLWLWERYGIETRNLREDTRLMSHAVYPEMDKSLAFLAANFTDFGPWKGLVSHHTSGERDAT
jgi:uracil-DNA glycosylase